jgi:tetratricopeptide (TPR) repeat protein
MFKRYLLVFSLFLVLKVSAQQMPECWYRSQAAFDKGEYNLALQWNDSCLADKPKTYIFWVRRGEILFNLGGYNQAIETSLKSEKMKPGSAAYTLAKSYCMIGDTAAGFVWLTDYLGQADKYPEGKIKLDPAFDKIAVSKRWRNLWMKDWYSPYEKLVTDAAYSIENKQWEEALDLLNPRLKGNRPRPQLLVLRAESYHGILDYRDAVDDYSIAIKRSKKNHGYLAGRALSYIALEKYNAAIDDLNKAIELSGGKPQYYKSRAEAYYKNKQFDKAFDDIKYYMTFYPSDTEASFQLVTIAVEGGYYVDALFSLGKLIKTNPNDPKNYYWRGIAYLKTQNYSMAEIDLNIAIAKGFNLSDSYLYRAKVLLGLGKMDEACLDIENAVKKGNFDAQELYYKYCKKTLLREKWY